MSLHFLTDLGGIWSQRDHAEPRGGQAVPERRAPRAHPVLPVPGGGGDLHVPGLAGGEVNQAAEGVSDQVPVCFLGPPWPVVAALRCQRGLGRLPTRLHKDLLAFSSSFLPPPSILTASVHAEDATSAEAK